LSFPLALPGDDGQAGDGQASELGGKMKARGSIWGGVDSRRRWRGGLLALALLLLLVPAMLAGCGDDEATEGGDATTSEAVATTAGDTATTAAPSGDTSEVVLASTTSTQDSGLFDELIPAFEEAYPEYRVQVIAVGSGEAMRLGEEKAADVLLVHSPAAEEEFVANGFGTERQDVMYNDFIIVGPADDPAGIKGMTSAADAFTQIAESESTFVSRGDESGTHAKEKTIWEAAALEPNGDWYQSAGQGMGEVLRISSEQGAYTLTDRATYLSAQDTLDLEIMVEGDEALFNQYGVIPVTDANNQEGAQAFADWIVSPEAQELIGSFGVEEFGEPLFVPNAA
jgi:tungstate transport system substrate-binding protein